MEKKSGPSGRDLWPHLKKAFETWRDSLSDTYHEIRKETGLVNEILLYIPFVVSLLFFYYTNRIAWFYHSFGNYGYEEGFLQSVAPLVAELRRGLLTGLSLGLDGPLYPLVLAAKAFIGKSDVFRNALFLNVLFGTLSLFLSYYLLRRLFNTRTAVVSLLLIATNATYFEFTYTACAGPLFFLLTVASVSAFFAARDASPRRAGLYLVNSGVFAALSALTLGVGLMLVPFVLMAVYYFRTHGDEERSKHRTALLFGVGFVPIFAVVALFVKAHAVNALKAPVLVGKGGGLAAAALKNLYFNLFLDIGGLTGWILGVFALLGVVVVVLSDNTKSQLSFYSLGLFMFGGLALLPYNRFYSFGLILFYIPLAVAVFGLGHYRKVLEKRIAFGLLGIFALAALISAYRNLESIGRITKGEPRHLVELANAWLRLPTDERAPILSRMPLLSRRVGAGHVALPDSIRDFRSLYAYARARGAGYFLADYPEFNTHPSLRVLTDPEVKAPFGLQEVARKGVSALYRIDPSREPRPDVPAWQPFTLYQALAGKSTASREPDSISAFLRSQLRVKDITALGAPPYQIVSSYRLDGYALLGLLFKGPFGEVVSANYYQPAALQSGGMAASAVPACLILAGVDTAGKAAPQVRNYAEPLARAGTAVLAIDWPGAGERAQFGQSYAVFAQYQYASGRSPAEIFLYELLSARNFLTGQSGVRADSVTLIAFDEDGWTALFAGLLDSAFQEILFVGGLPPLRDLGVFEDRPFRTLFEGVAGRYSTEDLFRCLRGRRLIYAAIAPFQNGWGTLLALTAGGELLPAEDNNTFVSKNFGKSLKALSAFRTLDNVAPENFSFRAMSDMEQRMTATVGPGNMANLSPSLAALGHGLMTDRLLDSLRRPPDTLRRLDSTAGPTLVESLKGDSGFTVRRVRTGIKTPVPTLWVEYAPVKPRGPLRVLVLPSQEDPGLETDTGLTLRALRAGYTVARLNFFEPARDHSERLRRLYDYASLGLSFRETFELHLRRIVSHYKTRPDLCAADPVSMAVGLSALKRDSTLFRRVLLGKLTIRSVEGMAEHPFSGYDGRTDPLSAHESFANFASCVLLREYGDLDFEEEVSKLAVPAVLHDGDEESIWMVDEVPGKIRRVTHPDSLFVE